MASSNKIEKEESDNYSIFFGLISALKLFKDKYLFAGTGNFLSVFKIKGKEHLKLKIKIFESEKISKINIFNITNNEFFIVLSGETKLKYSFFNENDFKIDFNEIITKSHDYIMDHIYYSYSIDENEYKYLIIGFINNFLEIYSFNNSNHSFEFTKFIYPPVKCIVYSMAFTLLNNNDSLNLNNQENDSIIIASGTVFRKVIIWQINYNKNKKEFIKDDKNILQLTGHKGVIFSVHFYFNNTLCSTSDDRVTKFWKFDLINKTFHSDDYTGHASRIWDSKIYEPKKILVSVSEDATALIYDLNTKSCIRKLQNGHEGWNIRSVEINEKYIWTGGEDGRLIKWNYSKIKGGNIKNEKENDNNSENKEIVIKLKNEGSQFELACVKQKQKNFKCSIKVVKFINDKLVILGTNHGQILGYKFNDYNTDEKNNLIIFYEDKEARVVNSMDFIRECNLIIVGLNEGNIVVISFDDLNLDDNKIVNLNSCLIQIFNERVTFISHKILDKDKLFLIISTEKSKTKICFINNFTQKKIIDILGNKNSLLYFICPFESQINTFEIKKVENEDLSIDNNKYIIFLGDYEGKILFTQITKISNNLYLFSHLLKYLQIFKKSIITSIIYSQNQKTLFVYSRNNKIKKYILTNEYSSLLSLKEIESQNNQGISSYEKILFKDLESFEEDKYFIVGHNGRDLIIYDIFLNKIIHTNDVKGVNKPLDLYLDEKNNKIYYISCQSDTSKIFKININQNFDNNSEEKINDDLLISNSYCLPVNGRVIHDIGFLNLKNNKYLLFTAGEDTKIKFYYINNINNIFSLSDIYNEEKSIIYIGDFKMHDCAVRKIIFIQRINNEFYFCSIGAKKEIFIFKLILEDLSKPKFICIENISQNKSSNFKTNSKIVIESNVENSRNMDLSVICLNYNKYEIAITDTIDETTIFNINFNNQRNYKNDYNNLEIQKRSNKFTSSNFIPLCISHCTNKFLLYGQSNGILRIYNNENQKENFFKLHEAGINEIKIKESMNDKNIFLIFTCGEDCTLVISEFDIKENKINVINKIKSIHFSAIKSIDLIENKNELIILSAGYDQIVNISALNRLNYSFNNMKSFHICVSEINSIKGNIITNEKNESILYIAIGGLGIEFLKYKL